jgi:hypothetical protein
MRHGSKSIDNNSMLFLYNGQLKERRETAVLEVQKVMVEER